MVTDLFTNVRTVVDGIANMSLQQVLILAMAMTAAFACLATLAVVLVPASTGSGIPGADHGLIG